MDDVGGDKWPRSSARTTPNLDAEHCAVDVAPAVVLARHLRDARGLPAEDDAGSSDNRSNQSLVIPRCYRQRAKMSTSARRSPKIS